MTPTTADDAFLNAMLQAPSAEKLLKQLPIRRAQWGLEVWSWVGRRGWNVFAAPDLPTLLHLLEATAAKAPFEDVFAFFRRLEASRIGYFAVLGCAQNYKKNKKAWDASVGELSEAGRALIALERAGGLNGTPPKLDFPLDGLLDSLAQSAIDGLGDCHSMVVKALGGDLDAWFRQIAARLRVPLHPMQLMRDPIVDALVHANWEVVEHVLAVHPNVNIDRVLLARGDDFDQVLAALGERAYDWRRVGLVVQLAGARGARLPDGYETALVRAFEVGVQDPELVAVLATVLGPDRLRAVARDAFDACEKAGTRSALLLLRFVGDPELSDRAEAALRDAFETDRDVQRVVEALGLAGASGAAVLRRVRDSLDGAANPQAARRRLVIQSGLFTAARIDPPSSIDDLLPNTDLAFFEVGRPLFEGWQETRAMLGSLPEELRAPLAESWSRADFDGKLDAGTRFGTVPGRIDVYTVDFAVIEELLPIASTSRLDLNLLGRQDVALERRERVLETLLARPDSQEHAGLFIAVVAMAYRDLGPQHFEAGTVWDRAILSGLSRVESSTLHWFVDKPSAAVARWCQRLDELGRDAMASELRERAGSSSP